ncbi:MAG: hypothetical protein MK213_03150 [Planctomycetes bacterium]|nr:hypothetical protein [Planctomycetota bacterium]
MTIAGKLFLDGPLSGSTNMSRDEALLESQCGPSLRWYQWDVPTLSLGYFQAADEVQKESVLARGGQVVRRSSGGKAILHEHEWTYSLCAPEVGALGQGPGPSMRVLHQAFAEELSHMTGEDILFREEAHALSDQPGSGWCFEDSSPLDLMLQGRKLLGSAARRRQGWILFHGSLVVQPPKETPEIGALHTEPNLQRLTKALGTALELDWQPAEWPEEVLQTAATIAEDRFGQQAFTEKR